MDTLNYDVVVAGAGPAGIAAAVEAARDGAKTAIIERYGCVGGNLTVGLVGPVLGSVCGGTIAEEMCRVCCPRGNMPDAESAKLGLLELLDGAGADVFLQTQVTGVEKYESMVEAVLASGKTDDFRFASRAFIDATGDGDVAYRAGCDCAFGRDGDGLVQPVSMMFMIDGIDPAQTLICEHEEHYTALANGEEYLDLCHRACADGRLPANVNIVRLYATGVPGERMVNATQANRVDPLDRSSVVRAELELRRQAERITAFLRENVPGFENIRIKVGPSTLGVRESRRVIAPHVLTAAELIAGARFPDAVVEGANFSIDIHNPAGPGQAAGEERCPVRPKPYDIPLSAMTPVNADNLLTAGRCISGTHEAHASYRVMRICMAMGQAAGAAAAIMKRNGLASAKDVDAAEVRALLRSRGATLEER